MDTSREEPKGMVKPPRSFGEREWSQIDKQRAFIIFFLHVLCIFVPFQFNWSAFWVAFGLYIITGLFGITLSYHRNLAHRSFKLSKWLEYLLAYCGVHAFKGDPIDWVSMHRSHHQFADTEKDPQIHVRGLLFGHVTWPLDSYAWTKKVFPNYFIVFQEIEINIFLMVKKLVRQNNVGDLENQTFYRFLHNTYLLHPIALAVLLYAVGGIPFLIWGMCVRIVMVLHGSFMVNLICHRLGRQQWNTGDLSRNNLWVSLVTFGEGWHNNHHAFKYSARHGLEWWQIDFGWYVIMFLQAIGVATQVKLPSQTHKQKMAMDKPKEALPKS